MDENNQSDKKNLSVGFCTFEKYEGRKDIGSSRIRAQWLCNYWPDAEIYKQGKKYDVIVFQKSYWVKMAEKFKGIKIFDICDADFLHWGYHTAEMIENCDAVVASTKTLAEQFGKFTDKPVVYIPDRIDIKKFIEKKKHVGRAKTAVWFGYSDNYPLLNSAIVALEKLELNLIVISNGIYNPGSIFTGKCSNVKWDAETINSEILKGDIVLNPRIESGRWKFKSNNKTLMSWALGMPVAHDMGELGKFIYEEERKKDVEARQKEIREQWDVKISVDEYKWLINYLSNDAK